MIYYKVLDKNNVLLGIVDLDAFRFYSPQRKRMYMTQKLAEAQYIILNGEYYKVTWLKEDIYNQNKYPEVNLIITNEEEYKNYIQSKEQNSEEK